MMDARTEILERIREALGDPAPPVDVPRDYQRTTPADIDVVQRFAERVADYRATVHEAPGASIATVIGDVIRSRGIARLVVPAGVPGAWLDDADIELLADDPPLDHATLDAVDGTITTCAVAIAETGTIVLDTGSGQGRRVLTLLPDRHICVVDAARIVGDVPEALEKLDPRLPLTWISGPSATSDIELERVEGVHGPRVLDVIIVRS
jgi:L-lactate dehydrogenase complex protein LldG